MKANIAKIRLRECGRLYSADAGSLQLKWHDGVIVEFNDCKQFGLVLVPPGEQDIESVEVKILRKVTPEDIQTINNNKQLEEEAWKFCIERINARGLEMRLIRVHVFFDRKKIMFYYTADHRIDFRELVKDLARRFRTRIEMRQVGIRDATKIIGGIGYCGRELCCATVITRFEPVPVKAAKEQNLFLNPLKISGLCGKLMCCISYESEIYKELLKGFPKIGDKIKTPKGNGEVISISIFNKIIGVRLEDGEQINVTRDELMINGQEAKEGSETKT
jgi:cell fate regulator YaaT (PSP1 superfamily)